MALNLEELGRRRFQDNKSFRKALSESSKDYLSQIQDLIASNYSKDYSTNLAILNRVLARELARIKSSNDSISSDIQYTQTRIQYLQQILGERLFLTDKIAPADYNDETYRNYLISIKNAYLAGSKKTTIEDLASEFTGQQIHIKELYLEARTPGSSLDVSDSNSMIVEVFIDDYLRAGYNINSLKQDLDFFINLVKPAHVLYDTRLIWTETIDVNKVYGIIFGDTGGGCIPTYDYDLFEEPTILALHIYVLPNSTGSTGQIDSIHHDEQIFYLSNSTRVIVEPGLEGTKIFDVNGKQISFNALEISQYVRILYQVIPGNFQFYWKPTILLPTWSSQFYRTIYRRPLFQGNVVKVMDENGRFPLQTKTTSTTICDRWVQDTLQPLYEDLRRSCNGGSSHYRIYNTVPSNISSPHFSWPYTTIQDRDLLGNDYSYLMQHTPLTDGSSSPATISDISLTIDGTSLIQPIVSVDASSGVVTIQDSTTYWDQTAGFYPRPGNEFIFSYHYLSDNSNYDVTTSVCYGISFWQMPKAPLVKDETGNLADIGDIEVSVDGTTISNAVTGINAIYGHVTLNNYSDFWLASEIGYLPQIDSTFSFEFYYGIRYQYSMLFDDPERVFDSALGQSNTGFVFDGDSTNMNQPVIADSAIEIGYRYRGYLLHHSSVLNSPDTLKLNEYQKPANRASIINQQDVFNHYNKFFSPEFLYDTTSPIVLDDNYLINGLDPILNLNEGTPPFQKTFSYHPYLIYHKKLQDLRTNHQLLLYSDMLLKETRKGNSEVNLSSVCDTDGMTIKTGFKETLSPLAECPPWILFDTVEYTNTVVNIPGEYRGVPNLRIIGKYLRDNFILREVEPTGTAIYSYSFTTPIDQAPQTEFYLPSSFKYEIDSHEYIDFPSLPIVNSTGGSATISDITVIINGSPWVVTGLNPITGWVQIQDFPNLVRVEEEYTLTQTDVLGHRIILPGYALDPENSSLTIIHGTSQYYGDDFYVNGRYLIWAGGPLDGLLSAGDKIRVSYDVDPLVGADIEFIYRINSSAAIDVLDENSSRIFDDQYVFPGRCYDEYKTELEMRQYEYLPGLDDNGEGIKYVFLNKDTLQIEDHVFSGPVFDYYCSKDDEIGSPDNFPNALVRLKSPTHATNPLNYITDYGFLTDKAVRFRKRTFKELLPDRTFRTTRIIEMLPI